MLATLWFSRQIFSNSTSCVLSLQPKADSGLVLRCAGTNISASSGHLEIDFDLDLLSGGGAEPGYLAFKTLSGNTLLRGPVVEGVKAGSANVTVTGDGTLASGHAYGKVLITVFDNLAGLEYSPETIRLAGARDVFFDGVIGIGFDQAKLASFYGRIGMRGAPALPAGTTMQLRFLLLGRAAGAIPTDILAVTYRRIPAPAGNNAPVALPLIDAPLTLDCTTTLTGANQYFQVETEEFEVVAGDEILFSVTRSAVDAYVGELDVIRKCGVLVIPES
jgi:hypothetical protein